MSIIYLFFCPPSDTSSPKLHKEISDSLQILLAIGTNSNDEPKEGEQSSDSSKNICSLQNLMGFTPEEVIKLQELFKLLASRTKHDIGFLNHPSGLDDSD